MAKALQITYQVIRQIPDNDLQLNFSVVCYIKFINDHCTAIDCDQILEGIIL